MIRAALSFKCLFAVRGRRAGSGSAAGAAVSSFVSGIALATGARVGRGGRGIRAVTDVFRGRHEAHDGTFNARERAA